MCLTRIQLGERSLSWRWSLVGGLHVVLPCCVQHSVGATAIVLLFVVVTTALAVLQLWLSLVWLVPQDFPAMDHRNRPKWSAWPRSKWQSETLICSKTDGANQLWSFYDGGVHCSTSARDHKYRSKVSPSQRWVCFCSSILFQNRPLRSRRTQVGLNCWCTSLVFAWC